MARSDIHRLRNPLSDLYGQSSVWAAYFVLRGWALYGLAFALAAFAHPLWLRAVGAVVLAPAIALLFRIAHDCGHDCHFRGRGMNRLAGRLCLLPAYHPHEAWIRLHNHRHHAFTNLRGRDYIWVPLSKAEYDRMGVLGRLRERVYRTTAGVGLYYLHGVWWRQMIGSEPPVQARVRQRAALDRALVLAFFGLQLAALSLGRPSASDYLLRVLLCLILPFLGFNWMVGFVSFLNHTHPQIPWFARRRAWSFYAGQVGCTAHVRPPPWLFLFLTDLGRHGAHHIAPQVPIAALPKAEARLEALTGEAVRERWSLRRHREIMRCCKLYDYDGRFWMDFKGRATTPSLL